MAKKQKPDQIITNGLVLRSDASFDTEPRFKTLLLKGFIVYLVVMGSMGCLLSSFKIPYDALVINIAVFVGALFSAFLYYTKVWENLGYFILFAFMLGTALMFRRYISSGFFAVVNIISERIAYYFDTEVVQGYAEAVGNRAVTVTIAMVYIGWVHAILLNALISRQMKYFAVMFASFFFLTIPLYLEREPDMLYILMLLAGCVLVFTFRGAKHTPITKNDQKFEYLPKKRFINYVYSIKTHLTVVVTIMLLVAVFGGVFQIFVNKDEFESVNRARSSWKIATEDTVENVYKNGLLGLFNRYDSTGGLKSGVLGGVNSVNLDYETDLEVTYVPYSTDRVYLKSFTGDRYLPFENRWEKSDNEESEPDTAGLLKKRYEKGERGSAKARMDVKNIAANLRAFLPYYVESGTNIMSMSYRKLYDLTYYPLLTSPNSSDDKNGNDKSASLSEKKSGKNTKETVVKKSRYLSVPKENRETIALFIVGSGMYDYWKKNGNRPMGAVNALAEYFQKNIPYTYQPGATPRGKDFINYFLDDNKRGYCAHFASAATLIFRGLGYEARYAEGYAIDPTDLAEDAKIRDDLKVSDYYDGDMALGTASKVVQVSVTDAMAHAWVEIKVDGHWIPVEVTPWSDEETPSGGFLQGLIEFFAGTATGSGNTSEISGDSGGGGLDAFGSILGYGIFIIIAVATGVFLLIILVRTLAGRLRFARAGYADRLVMEFGRVKIDKRSFSIRRSRVRRHAVINYRDKVDAMSEMKGHTINDSEKAELTGILEKAGFSKKGITAEEYDRARELIKR